MKNLLFDIPYLWSAFIGFGVMFLTLGIDLWTDGKLAKQKLIDMDSRGVKHGLGAILRLPGIIIACIFIGWHGAAFVLFGYWLLMDIGMGLILVKDASYIGTSGTLDKLQRKYEWIVRVKQIGAIASLSYYIIKIVS